MARQKKLSRLTGSCGAYRSDHPLQMGFLGICARPDHDIADDHLDNRADPDH